MRDMLIGPVSRYPAAFEAGLLALVFFLLFGAIAFLVFRPRSRPVFARASRLPLETEEL